MRLLINIANFENEYTIFRIVSNEKDILRGGEFEVAEKIIYKAEHLFFPLLEAFEETKRLISYYIISMENVFIQSKGGTSTAFNLLMEKL